MQPRNTVVYKSDTDWKQGRVLSEADTPRSFWVKGKDGSEIRRNRRHLKIRPYSSHETKNETVQ